MAERVDLGRRFASWVAVHADANNLKSSLKFVAKPRLDYVPSSIIEDAIDRFVRAVLESAGDASDGLGTEYRQLQSERTEPSVAAWRKLEAMLGFDPDGAPDGLVARLETLSETIQNSPSPVTGMALLRPRSSPMRHRMGGGSNGKPSNECGRALRSQQRASGAHRIELIGRLFIGCA